MTLPLLTSSLLARAGFPHAFSTRAAGDFALTHDPPGLQARQEKLAQKVGFELSRFFQVTQVHGTRLVEAAGTPDPAVEADAIAGTQAGDAVAVRVADCVPLLLADPESGHVAAVHAGWRGVEAGVVRSGVQHFENATRLLAAIGPCIGACCFEVDADVADRIARVSKAEVVVYRSGAKAFVDLRAAVRAQLRAHGVTAIEDVPGCTSCDERFYSYRRDREESGRLVAVIVTAARRQGRSGSRP